MAFLACPFCGSEFLASRNAAHEKGIIKITTDKTIIYVQPEEKQQLLNHLNCCSCSWKGKISDLIESRQ